MRLIALLVALAWPALVAAECGEPDVKHWTTKLESKPPVTLHWTGVYEGLDSICEVTYPDKSTLKVWGQPVTSKNKRLIALLSCADDGCERTVSVVDVSKKKVLTTELALPEDTQFYLKGSWTGRAELKVELEDSGTMFLCKAEGALVCKKTESN